MDTTLLSVVAITALTSLMATNWIYFKILKIAKDKNLVDNPDARKLQKEPIPVMGGITVFFGVIFGLLAGVASYYAIEHDPFVDTDIILQMLPIVLSMSIMLYIGTSDDIIGLTPRARFIVEGVVLIGIIFASGGCIDSLHGLWGINSYSWYVAIPLTIFSGVGIINAINMVDGVNGLSSGLCITYSLLFGFVFIILGDIANAMLAFAIGTALFPFFIHNVFGNTSRMFIGDGGTMIMGILMTWFVICIMRNDSAFCTYAHNLSAPAMVLSILAVPVADTLRVMTMRIAHKKSPFNPDKTHLHHAFVGMGISHSITALSEILINITVVAAWLISAYLGAPLQCQLYTVILVAAILVWGTYFFLVHEKTSNSKKAKWLRNFSIKTHLGNTEWWQRLTYRLDAPEFSVQERKNRKERMERKFRN